jgi:hypothetical protein
LAGKVEGLDQPVLRAMVGYAIERVELVVEVKRVRKAGR